MRLIICGPNNLPFQTILSTYLRTQGFVECSVTVGSKLAVDLEGPVDEEETTILQSLGSDAKQPHRRSLS